MTIHYIGKLLTADTKNLCHFRYRQAEQPMQSCRTDSPDAVVSALPLLLPLIFDSLYYSCCCISSLMIIDPINIADTAV